VAEPAERGGRGVLEKKKRDECMHHINARRWRRWRAQVTGHLTWPAGRRKEGKGGKNARHGRRDGGGEADRPRQWGAAWGMPRGRLGTMRRMTIRMVAIIKI